MPGALLLCDGLGSAPAGTRTRAHGLGNRCSIRLSYRGTYLKGAYFRVARPV